MEKCVAQISTYRICCVTCDEKIVLTTVTEEKAGAIQNNYFKKIITSKS